MCTSNPRRGAVQVEVDAPERSSKRIGQSRRAFVVQTVGLAEDIRYACAREQIGFVQVVRYRQYGRRVVHQCALQSHAGLCGAADITCRLVSKIVR